MRRQMVAEPEIGFAQLVQLVGAVVPQVRVVPEVGRPPLPIGKPAIGHNCRFRVEHRNDVRHPGALLRQGAAIPALVRAPGKLGEPEAADLEALAIEIIHEPLQRSDADIHVPLPHLGFAQIAPRLIHVEAQVRHRLRAAGQRVAALEEPGQPVALPHHADACVLLRERLRYGGAHKGGVALLACLCGQAHPSLQPSLHRHARAAHVSLVGLVEAQHDGDGWRRSWREGHVLAAPELRHQLHVSEVLQAEAPRHAARLPVVPPG
mmetsp:Transcript_17164/g.44173  ORF Transcript_17164/g.44173 Transcript_17164/m.44173 type:complete len:264 (-) Transcript_17164:108-899(-)